MSMTSLLLHESEAKPRMGVNNKDIIRMYLGYKINAFFVNSKLCSPILKLPFGTKNIIIPLMFFLGDIYLSS